MVEGLLEFILNISREKVRDLIRIAQHVTCRNPHNLDSLAIQPSRAFLVERRLIAHVVDDTIHLNRQPGLRAIEVEHESPDGMLAAKADSLRITT